MKVTLVVEPKKTPPTFHGLEVGDVFTWGLQQVWCMKLSEDRILELDSKVVKLAYVVRTENFKVAESVEIRIGVA